MSEASKRDEDMDTTGVDESSQEISPPSKGFDNDSDRPPSPPGADDSLTNFVKQECVRQESARNAVGSSNSEPRIPPDRLEGFFANAYAAISRMQTETKRINAGRERLEQLNTNPETGIWEEEMQKEMAESAILWDVGDEKEIDFWNVEIDSHC